MRHPGSSIFKSARAGHCRGAKSSPRRGKCLGALPHATAGGLAFHTFAIAVALLSRSEYIVCRHAKVMFGNFMLSRNKQAAYLRFSKNGHAHLCRGEIRQEKEVHTSRKNFC
jgi:hypothetical protein